MSDEKISPDAILFPAHHKTGKTSFARVHNIQVKHGPTLGGTNYTSLGPKHGGRVHTRDVGGGLYLVTLSHEDTLLFPNDHPHAKQQRYRWEEQEDGTQHGWLLTDEELEKQATVETTLTRLKRLPELEAAKQAAEAKDAMLKEWRALATIGGDLTHDQQARLQDLEHKLFPEDHS